MSTFHCSRRGLLGLGLAAGTGAFALPRTASAQTPTPSCVEGGDPTPAQTEGPYFKPNSPERSDLRSGVDGRPMSLAGLALDRQCRPIAGSLIELWHANSAGQYDNQGYDLRGHIFTDVEGRFHFETVVPGLYPGRTRHFHLKVQPPGGAVLTTQLYFPGEPGNERDRIFDAALLMQVATGDAGQIGRYDFVLG